MSQRCFERCSYAKNCVENVKELKGNWRPTITDVRQQRFGEFLLTRVPECDPEIVGSAQYCILNQITTDLLVDAIQQEQ